MAIDGLFSAGFNIFMLSFLYHKETRRKKNKLLMVAATASILYACSVNIVCTVLPFLPSVVVRQQQFYVKKTLGV
jgi:hypothetical protein